MIDRPKMESPSPDAAQKESSSATPTLARIRLASRFALTILGTLYTVGLLIVNIDLARYGVISLDLARAEYVMAAALWGLLMLASGATIDWIRNAFAVFRHTKKTARGVFGFVGNILFTLAIFHYVLWILSKGEISLLALSSSKASWAFAWIIIGASAPRALAYSLDNLLGDDSIRLRSFVEGRNLATVPLYAFDFALSTLGAYALYVHPLLPREYGGGNRTPVFS